MLSPVQALLLGLLQGATELFPISSLGHTVIVPSVLGWHIDQNDPFFLSFIVATHVATALTLFAFFWSDWLKILGGVLRSLRTRVIEQSDTYAKLGWMLVVSTIPAGILGLLFDERIKALFASPRAAAVFLLLNGMLLFGAELFRRKRARGEAHDDARIARLSWAQAVKIGCVQCLALLPGFSRTGTTLAGGLRYGLSHEDAARYSFLLATPIIFAAGVLQAPALLQTLDTSNAWLLLLGAACAAIAAYLSVRFLSRYFKTNTLLPFAAYCVAAGLLALVILP